MFFFTKYRSFSSEFQIFSLAVAALCLPAFSTMAYASKADNGSNLSTSPTSPTASNDQGSKKIQKEAYAYQHQTPANTNVSNIEVQQAVLKKSSNALMEGSFILKNKANKDFLLKEITAEKCKTVGQFQDNQTSIETAEEGSGNIFKNLPIAHLNTISFPFSSFHIACVPKDDSSFEEGSEIPFIFHFQEGDQTYNFIVENNTKS